MTISSFMLEPSVENKRGGGNTKREGGNIYPLLGTTCQD